MSLSKQSRSAVQEVVAQYAGFQQTKYNLSRWNQLHVTAAKMTASDAAAPCSEKKQFECNLCRRKFVHFSGLVLHKKKYHPDQNPPAVEEPNSFTATILCTHCGELFTDVDQYQRHSVAFDWNAMLAQLPPEVEQRYELAFLKHLRIIIVSMTFKCEFCDAPFSKLAALIQHESLHDPADGFSCPSCDACLPTLEKLVVHRTNKPEAFESEHARVIPGEWNRYCCNVCFDTFKTLRELYEHRFASGHFFPRVSNHGDGLLERCAFCGFLSGSVSELLKHYNENHAQKVVGKQGNGAVAVPSRRAVEDPVLFEKTTPPPPEQQPPPKEASSTSEVRPYLCDICGKTYTQSSHLWQHQRFHNGIRPFVCPRAPCKRSFTIRPDLNDHIRKCHTGERPYECLICGKRFLTGSVYYQHRLIHRGERRYACTDCDKRFYRADALKNHQRIHTGERPYECEVCARKFRQRGDREKHLRVRHEQMR